MDKIILSIDTATGVCSAALSQGDRLLAGYYEEGECNHARLLPLFIADLTNELERLHCHPDAVAVSAGPGSYTGLRIGVSTAKGLAYGWHVPLIAVPTPEVLCAALLQRYEPNPQTLLCPMLDARRMEVYAALYDQHLQIVQEVKPWVVTDGLLPTEGQVCYFGNGAAKCQEVLPSDTWHYVDGIQADARVMGALATARLQAGKTEDVAYFEPYYLKEFVAAPAHVKGLQA